jgi:hypothetical protein
MKKKLVDILENDFCFRDYIIKDVKYFGKFNKIAVHQVIDDPESMEYDVRDAIYNFSRDGFPLIVFYIEKPKKKTKLKLLKFE